MKRSSTRNRSQAVAGWAFVSPYVLFLVVFGAAPAAYAVYQSFDQSARSGGFGLGNYIASFADFRFLPALVNVLVFMVIWIPIMLVGTIALALLLHEKIGRTTSVLRLVYFLPGAVTGSAAVLLWYFMLDPALSPFAGALKALGFNSANEVFQSSHLPWIFALVAFVTGVGQWVVIMFGALQGIPDELLEAARVDGARPVRIALAIKVPLIAKYVFYMVILAFAAGLQIFVEPTLFYSITQAGSQWWSLNQLAFVFAFQQGDFGSAATVSIVLLVLSLIGALILIFKTDFFQTDASES